MTPLTSSAAIGDGIRIEPATSTSGATSGAFGSALGKALSSVDQLQVSADQQASALAEGQGNLHETAIALAKAEVGMHLLLKVRNKVVEAYQDIMKMGV